VTDVIAWDLETHLIKPGQVYPKLVCYSEAPGCRLLAGEDSLNRAEEVLRNFSSVGHNIFFDLGVVAAERPHLLPVIFNAIEENRVTCTLLRQKMIDNSKGEMKYVWSEESNKYKATSGFSLQQVAKRLLGIELPKVDTWRLRFRELDGVNLSQWPKEAAEYSIRDACVTLDVYSEQERLWPAGMTNEAKQIESGWALHLTGGWGVRTDKKRVKSTKARILAAYREHMTTAKKHGFVRADGSRNMLEVKSAVAECLESPALTDKGNIKTDREQLLKTGHPGLNAVAEMVRVGKLLTTYIPVLEKGVTYPITPRYNTIVETFRTSCSSPNLQNPPREGGIRECFIARDGCHFAFCDFDSIEMATLAQVCVDLFGESRIAEVLRQGKDPHIIMAGESLGIPYGEAFRRHAERDPHLKQVRQFSKIANYGFAGGMGPRTFVSYAKGYGVDASMIEAKGLHSNFRKSWPEMVKYFNHAADLCARGAGIAECVKLPRSGYYRGDVKFTALCNTGFQHLAAMGAKESLYEVTKECYIVKDSPLYGCRPWLFAHDEIGLEIPTYAVGKHGRHLAAMRLQQVMVDTMKKWCPDVPIKATVALCKRWWKGAEPVLEGGILVPVKPKDKGKGWERDDG